MIGSLERMKTAIDQVGLTADEGRQVLEGNARELLGIA
jgi:hypothetical protein